MVDSKHHMADVYLERQTTVAVQPLRRVRGLRNSTYLLFSRVRCSREHERGSYSDQLTAPQRHDVKDAPSSRDTYHEIWV